MLNLDTLALDRAPPDRQAALAAKIASYRLAQEREQCEDSLLAFMRGAWPYVVNTPFQSCFAVEAMCLPYDSKITTREGEKEIGEIVETGWRGDVLSYSHSSLRHEWKPIVFHMKSAGTRSVVVEATDGTVLKLTANHPVFVSGRGYVQAEQLRPGDKLLQALSEEISVAEERERVLPPGMLSRAQERRGEGEAHSTLCQLRKTLLSAPFTATRRVLQYAMLWRGKDLTALDYLSKLWWRKDVGRERVSRLFRQVTAQGQNLSVQSLWNGRVSFAGAVCADDARAWGILQSEMFWAGDQGREPSPVRRRFLSRRVSAGFPYSAASNKKEGKATLLSVLAEWSTRHASHRQKQRQQQLGQPCGAMSSLPSETASALEKGKDPRSEYTIGAVTVQSIKRETRIPKAVYNIEVLDNHNYFADSVLVHNCDHLEAVTLGHIKRLLINIPPRTGKTNLISVIYPAWVWARSEINYLSGPQVRFLCASHSHDLSLDSSTKSRRVLQSPWFQKLWPGKIVFEPDQNTKANFANAAGGERISASVTSQIIGKGGDCLIGDDLNKVGKGSEIESDAQREQAAAFWQEFHTTRLNDRRNSAIINVQQRLHEEDVSGLILRAVEEGKEDWVHLCVPMLYDPSRSYVTVKLPQYDDDEPYDDPRTEENELMWAERFSAKDITQDEQTLGPFLFAGRYQQLPVPKGGGIIQDTWWQLWDTEARTYGLEWTQGRKEFPPCELVIASLDTSYGEKQENDFNAMTVWGIWNDRNKNSRAILMYAWKKRIPLHGKGVTAYPGEIEIAFRERQKQAYGLVEWVADTCRRYGVQRLLIENKTRGVDVANELRRLYARENWGVQMINAVKDKVARTHSVVPLFTDGAIWAPNTKWAQMVIDEVKSFPKAKHDDLHDSVTQVLNWCRENGLLMRADEMSAVIADEMMYRPRVASVAASYGVQ